jgi:hypothetical protein
LLILLRASSNPHADNFKLQAFKSPSLVSPEKLYSLNVLDGMNELQLPLKDELNDAFVFCQTVETSQDCLTGSC